MKETTNHKQEVDCGQWHNLGEIMAHLSIWCLLLSFSTLCIVCLSLLATSNLL